MGAIGVRVEPDNSVSPTPVDVEAVVFGTDPTPELPGHIPPRPERDRASVALIAGTLISLSVLIWWFGLRVWGNADVNWSWLLVDQFASGAPKALSLVDGNRLFPDFLFGLSVWTVLHAVGVELLSRHYVVLYSAVVVGLSALGIARSVRDRRTTALAICILGAVLAPNLAYIESIRPGYHALSAAVSMLVIARRVRRIGQPYSAGELAVLTALVVSGRFLLTLLLIPLGFTDLLSKRVRAHRSWRLCFPAALGPAGWATLKDAPNVDVSYARTAFHPQKMPLWFLDYGRTLDWVIRSPGSLTLATHAGLLAALVAVGAVRFLRRSRSRPLSAQHRYFVILAYAVVEIGGATLRAGEYAVGWRAYIFVLPLVIGAAAIAVMLRSMISTRLARGVGSALLSCTVVATAWNGVTMERQPFNGALDPAYTMLKEQGLLDAVGLSNYWVSYEVRGNHDPGVAIYNVDGDLRPYYWSNNPWDHLYDRKSGKVDISRRIGYVLSYSNCGLRDCDAEKFTPRRDRIVQTLGEPDQWVYKRTPHANLRLAIYRKGADPSRYLALSFKLMRQAGISTHGYDKPAPQP